MDALFALLSAVKEGEITEAQAIKRLSRSPHWVWVAVYVQLVKTRITPPHATADRLREARTEPRCHTRQLRMPL